MRSEGEGRRQQIYVGSKEPSETHNEGVRRPTLDTHACGRVSYPSQRSACAEARAMAQDDQPIRFARLVKPAIEAAAFPESASGIRGPGRATRGEVVEGARGR